MASADRIDELEGCAFRAWPAARVEDLGGWRLRWSQGATRRGNSALPARAAGALSLEERIERTARFYRELGLAPRVQVAPNARPDGIDAALEARGWEVEAPVSIQVAEANPLAETASPDGIGLRADDTPCPGWWELASSRSRFRDAPEVLRGFLERIGAHAGYALAERAGEPIAMGLGVADGRWAGVFMMLTVPEARRSGAGSGVLGALARWARGRGAERLYLQVERDNPPALQLYARAGFAEAYGYHYRTAPGQA